MNRTLLLADHDTDRLQRLTLRLSDRGWHVLGPATTARLAMALAAQAPVGAALIGDRLSGRRSGRELARELARTWGVRCVPLDEMEASLEP